jgi:glucose/arabinose dehydrogenase
MHRARTLAVAVAALVAALAPAARAAPVTLAQIGSFNSPVYVTSPPGDPRLFVVEQVGTVRIVRDGTTLPTPFLNVRPLITSGGEQGLLSIAFPSDYATSGLFYAYYTSGDGNVVVAEFARSSDPDVADSTPRRTLFSIPHQEFANHNGGQLQFGPDGLLYAGTGDGGGGGDPHGNAQNPASRLGKLLRIDARQAGTQPENFALGLRNPWRFSFDRQTGDLAIADVGQDTIEEVDFAAAPGRGQGANYGWNRFEGNNQFSGSGDRSGLTFPVLTHTHADGWCSITGGYVVRDPSLPELAGRYVYGDYCKGDLYAANLAAGGGDDAPLGLHVASLTSFGEDACGRVYAASGNGPVYRLTSGGADCAAPAGTPPGGTSAPAPDRTRPSLGLSAPRRQRRGRTVRFSLRCSEQCAVAATARAIDRGVGTLTRRSLAAGARVALRVTLTTAARRALARALRRHRSVVLTLRVRGTDAAGNVTVTQQRIRLTR